jgi:hypothetical protein
LCHPLSEVFIGKSMKPLRGSPITFVYWRWVDTLTRNSF